MSDVMLFGVLRMPYEMAMSDELPRRQFYERAQQAAAELEALRAGRDEANERWRWERSHGCPHWGHHTSDGRDRVCWHGGPEKWSKDEKFYSDQIAELRTRLEAADRDAALWRAAYKQAWESVGMGDVLSPPGQPGSYARGHHNGFCEALEAIKATRDAAMQPKEQQAQKGEGV